MSLDEACNLARQWCEMKGYEVLKVTSDKDDPAVGPERWRDGFFNIGACIVLADHGRGDSDPWCHGINRILLKKYGCRASEARRNGCPIIAIWPDGAL
jgi:hypothetical protein